MLLYSAEPLSRSQKCYLLILAQNAAFELAIWKRPNRGYFWGLHTSCKAIATYQRSFFSRSNQLLFSSSSFRKLTDGINIAQKTNILRAESPPFKIIWFRYCNETNSNHETRAHNRCWYPTINPIANTPAIKNKIAWTHTTLHLTSEMTNSTGSP